MSAANGRAALRALIDNAEEVEVSAVTEPTPELDEREELIFEPGELARCIDRAETALAEMSADPATPVRNRIFERGGALVSITRVGGEERMVGRLEVPSGTLAIVTHTTPTGITERLDRCTRWIAPGARGFRPIQPPDLVARAILEGRRGFPRLDAVVSGPTVREDGSLITSEGYDERSRLYIDLGGVAWPAVPERPTRAQAEVALETLLEPFKGFPCATDADRAALAGLLLTAVARHALPTAPLGGIDAPAAGSGKTLLASSLALLASGVDPVVLPHDPTAPDELKKAIDAALIAGVPALVLDNIEGPIRSSQLAAIATSGRVSVRLLGFSRMMHLSTRALIVSTGNGLMPIGDLTSRFVLVRLDSGLEDPTARRFDRLALDVVRERRVELVSAALTVIRAGVCASAAHVPEHRPSRFPAWDRLVRRPLLWLGFGDAGQTLFTAQRQDPERSKAEALLAAWHDTFGPVEATIAQALDAPGMQTAIAAVVPVSTSDPRAAVRLGLYLRKLTDARAGGLVLRRRDGRAPLYRVELAEDPAPDRGGVAGVAGVSGGLSAPYIDTSPHFSRVGVGKPLQTPEPLHDDELRELFAEALSDLGPQSGQEVPQ